MKRAALALLAGASLLALASCRARTTSGKLPASEPFIALEQDFQDFQSWTRVRLDERPSVGSTHAAGEAHEFINQLPAPGSRTFPIGTILVKTVKATPELGDQANVHTEKRTDVFAMVKRGAGYNQRGTRGWEWFELRPRDDGSLGIVWRGVNPPSGEGYGGDPVGGCNGCHQAAVKNDYVHALALELAQR